MKIWNDIVVPMLNLAGLEKCHDLVGKFEALTKKQSTRTMRPKSLQSWMLRNTRELSRFLVMAFFMKLLMGSCIVVIGANVSRL